MPEEIYSTIENPQPVQPTEQKSFDWPKIILLAVLGLGLLASSAYAGYYYGTQQVQESEEPTPTPTIPIAEDETTDWETYTNKNYGYTIKYPADWTKEELDNPSFLHQLELKSEVETEESKKSTDLYPFKPTARFSIAVSTSSVEDLVASVNHMSDFKKITSKQVAGLIWETYQYKAGKDLTTEVTSLFSDREGRSFWVSWTIEVGDYTGLGDRLSGICDQIVSTVEFLDVEDQTKNWKTYTDATHNFSLKYPPSWQVTKGNEHTPSIPVSMTETIKLQSAVGTIDVSIIPWHNNLKKDLKEELSSFISRYFGDVNVSYEDDQIDGETALMGSYLQSAMGSQTKVILKAVEKGDYVLFFQTQFDIKDSSRLDLYNQILPTFKFLD